MNDFWGWKFCLGKANQTELNRDCSVILTLKDSSSLVHFSFINKILLSYKKKF